MDVNDWKVKATILLVSSLTIMSMITISASLPDMTKAFSHVTNGDALVKLSLSFPALFIALSAIITGLTIDKFGRLNLLGLALIFYTIGGTSGYWLDNIYLILAGRALLGVCVGITMTIATTLIADYYQGAERQKFAGTQIGIMSLAGILFVTIAGFLADLNWRFSFLLYAFSLIILPFSYLYLKEPKVHKNTNSVEKKIKAPSIIWFVFFNVMFMWIMFFIIPVQVPFYLKSIGIEQNALIGIAIASSTLFSAVSAFNYSWFKSKFSFYQILALGYLLMACAYIVMASIPSYSAVMISMLMAGLGMGILIPNANVWIMQLAPAEIRGKEIGKLTTFWFMGQFLAPLIILPFLNFMSQSQLFYVVSGVLMVVGITSFVIGSKVLKKSINRR